MPRNITVYFSDGSAHQYNNAPDAITPDDIELRSKQDYPNKHISRIDGGKTQSSNQQPSQSKNLSQFSIKGIRFGMTPQEVGSITGNLNAQDHYAAFSNFSIGGIKGWSAFSDLDTYNNKGPLSAMFFYFSKPEDTFDYLVEIFSKNYGKPSINSFAIGNKLGYKTTNEIATWKVNDVTITIKKYDEKLTMGSISIIWNNYSKDAANRDREKYNKIIKDF